jgi:hypothetical protein
MGQKKVRFDTTAHTETDWDDIQPRTKSERQRLKEKCGSNCFLRPSDLGYPVCAKGDCRYNCDGLLAAYKRANQYKATSIARNAKSLAKQGGCGWAQ